MDDYTKYEEECEKIRKDNAILLASFTTWLKYSNLSEKTVKNHVFNIDFYINQYLLYEEAIEAKDGIDHVDSFLGYWFIKKAMWSTKSSIKSNAISLTKFYSFLLEIGLISKNDLKELKEIIKEEMSEWLATVEQYNNFY